MKQIATFSLALVALLAVSACSATTGEGNDVYGNYEYTPTEVEATGYPVTDLIHMN